MTDQEFIEEVYELAFGEGSYGDSEYTYEKVLSRLKSFVLEMPNFVAELQEAIDADDVTADDVEYFERVIEDMQEFMERDTND